MSKLYGLIGFPLSHSFSKKYFTEKFAKEQLHDHEYHLFPLETIQELSVLLRLYPDLVGLNVTIPYKEQVFDFLDEIDEQAALVGAVNTIKIEKGKLKGYNTDIFGFEQSIRPLLDAKKTHHALILGTGGAAKAVEYIFKKLGITYQYISRRKQENILAYEEINESLISKSTIIVNTTPLGMPPMLTEAPNIPYNFLNANHLLYDLIYNPEKTVFLNKGLEQACQIKNGLEMLHLQAERAWGIWQGIPE